MAMFGDNTSTVNRVADVTATSPDHRYWRLTLWFVLAATVARVCYLLWGPMRLFPDEAYYWQWSRHLALSYTDAGPVTAYVIRLCTMIGGDRELAVRGGALVLSLGVTLLGCLLATDIFGHERAGFAAAVLLTVTPLFASGHVVMTYDTVEVFFWSLTCWLTWRIIKGRSSRLWYAVALSLGLGFLTKYTMLLLLPSLLGFLLSSRPARHWLRRPEPYAALLLLALLSSPVFVWNAQHAGVGFGHVGHQALGGGKGLHLSPRTFLQFCEQQAGIISPLLFFAVIAAVVAAGRRGFRGQDEGLLFLFWMSAPALAFFALWSFAAKVYANWPVAGYFAAAVAVAGSFHEALDKRQPPWRYRLRVGYLLASLVVALGLSLIGHDRAFARCYGDPLSRAMGPHRPGFGVARNWVVISTASGGRARGAIGSC